MRVENPTVALVEIENALVFYKNDNKIEFNDNLINALLATGISSIILIGKNFSTLEIEKIQLIKSHLSNKKIQVIAVISPADYAWHIDKNEAMKFLREFKSLNLNRVTGEDFLEAIKEKIFDQGQENRYPSIRDLLTNNNPVGQFKPGKIYEVICQGNIPGANDLKISDNLLGVASRSKAEPSSMGVLFAFCARHLQEAAYRKVIYVTPSDNALAAVYTTYSRINPQFFLSTVLIPKGKNDHLESYKSKLHDPLVALRIRLILIAEFLLNPLSHTNPLKEEILAIKKTISIADQKRCSEIEAELLKIYFQDKNTDFKTDARTAAIRDSKVMNCDDAEVKLGRLESALSFSPILKNINKNPLEIIFKSFDSQKDFKTLVRLTQTCGLFRTLVIEKLKDKGGLEGLHKTLKLQLESESLKILKNSAIERISELQKEFTYPEFKVKLLGDSGAGITSLKYCMVLGKSPNYASNLNKYEFLRVILEEAKLKLSVWEKDPIGNNEFGGVHVFIIVFDLTDQASLEHTKGHLDDIERYGYEKAAKVLVGNKCDSKDRVIKFDTAKEWADHLYIPYIETSAKTGKGVKELLETVAQEVSLFYPERIKSLNLLGGPGK